MISGPCVCNLPVPAVPEVPPCKMIGFTELVPHSLKRECCGPPSFDFFSRNGPTSIRKSFLYCSPSCYFLWMLPFPLLFHLVFCSTEFVYGFFLSMVWTFFTPSLGRQNLFLEASSSCMESTTLS